MRISTASGNERGSIRKPRSLPLAVLIHIPHFAIKKIGSASLSYSHPPLCP
jgi:hypothetical protein